MKIALLDFIELLAALLPRSVIAARKASTKTKPANLFAWHVQRGGTKRNRGNRNVKIALLDFVEKLAALMPRNVIAVRKAVIKPKLVNLFAWHVQRGGTKRNRGNRNVKIALLDFVEMLAAAALMPRSVIAARKAVTKPKLANLFAWNVQRGGIKRNRGNRNARSAHQNNIRTSKGARLV